MRVSKPSAIADQTFKIMKANTNKERSFYTQGQRFTARVLLTVWLLVSVSPEGILATPKRQMVPSTATSPGDPSLASAPPPPGGILQLPPDSPGSLWGGSVASSPSIERVFQQRMSQEALPFIERDLLRTSPKVTSVAENLSFQARGGERVRFACQMGQWRAEVSSHIGAFSRRAVLPIVCSQGTDVASSLEVLSRYSSWQRQRQIHVLDRNVCPTLGEVVYVGKLGLKGGGEGESSGSQILSFSHSRASQQGQLSLSGHGKRTLVYGHSIRVVERYMAQDSNPQNTAALVEAFNTTQDAAEKDACEQWLESCIEWFNTWKIAEAGKEKRTDYLEAYKHLAHIKPADASDTRSRTLLHDYFYSLYDKLKDRGDADRKISLLQSLVYALQHMDTSFFEAEDVDALTTLADHLLDMINPSRVNFTKATLLAHLPTLEALYHVLGVIQRLDPHWDTMREGPYRRYKHQLEEITAAGGSHYALCYHTELVLQSLSRLEDASRKNAAARQAALRRLGQGLSGALKLYQGIRLLTDFEIDLAVFQEAYEDLQKALTSLRIQDSPWYDWHQLLHTSCMLSLQDAAHYEGKFAAECQKLVGDQATAERSRKPLYYGLVLQLRWLALDSKAPAVRQGSLKQLEGLAKTPSWSSDQDLTEVLLDSVASVHLQGGSEPEKNAAKKVLESLMQDLSRSGGGKSTVPAVGRLAGLRNWWGHKRFLSTSRPSNVVEQWLGGAYSLEDKLRILRSELLPTSTSSADIQGDRLFQAVQQKLQKDIEKLPMAPLPAQEARQWLKDYYQQSAFKELRSFLKDEDPITVDKIACHLMIQEQIKREKEKPSRARQNWIKLTNRVKYQLRYMRRMRSQEQVKVGTEQEEEEPLSRQIRLQSDHPTTQEQAQVGTEQEEDQLSSRQARLQWVKRSIDLGELFNKRRIKADEPEKEINRVLLVGDAGTGKSALTRKLAYEWSQGNWGQAFEAVYVLPVRSLEKSEYDGTRYDREKTLATAIVNTCFAHNLPTKESDYNRLRECIKEELTKPTTLLILDGLDEQEGMSQEILKQAKGGIHKLLLTSRPYGIGSDRDKADLEVEHMGLNDEQAEAYIKYKFNKPEATILGASLWGYIKKNETIKEIARVPVNLEILCALWRDKGSGLREVLAQGSLPGLYSKVTIWLWKGYKDNPDPSAATRDRLFHMLGEIALNALKVGQMQINPYFIDNAVETEEDKSMLMESGLLEWVGSNSEAQSAFYQFPHLTFQEYFAGCWLARQFLRDGDEREQVKDFLTYQKYNASYGRTLSFLSGEISQQLSKKSMKYRSQQLQELLALLDSAPEEIVGLQQVLLKASVLYEWLRLASPEESLGLAEVASQVVERLQAWFSRRIEVKSQVGEENVQPLNQTPIAELIDDYWARQDSTLIPYIVGKLYQTPLIIRRAQIPGHQAAVIYLKSGGQQVWRQPAQAMDRFVKAIQDELSGMDPEILHTYSREDAQQILSYYERVLLIYEQLYKEEPNHPQVAKILYNLGRARCDLGSYKEAISDLRRALVIYDRLYKENPYQQELAGTLSNLGLAYERSDNHTSALRYYQRSLEMQQALHEGENHDDVAAALRSVGYAYQSLSKYTESLEYYQQALEMQQALHEGENHDEVARALRSVGWTYRNLGKYTEALEYCQKALEIRKTLYEGDHDDVALGLNDVGVAYSRLGNYTQALEYYQQALTMYQEVHKGESHADVARNLRNVGLTYGKLGKHTEALEYHQQALTMQQALHEGENHDNVAAALRTVGLTYGKLGKHTEALEYCQKALEIRKTLYEGDHDDVALGLNDVGAAYSRLGNYTQALEYYQQALTMYQEVHKGENHADVARNLRNVGLTYGKLGKHTEALEYYQQALTMQQALHEGENHDDVAAALRTVGLTCENLGNYTQALEYYQQALTMQQALHEGENHNDVAAALRTVGLTYGKLGKHTEALEYYQQALTMQQALHEGENHDDVAAALRTVGLTYGKLGKHTEALEYYQQALTMQQALHEGENHDDVAAALRTVGLTYGKLGKHTEALEYYQQALTMQKALHEGENHDDVAAALRTVGLTCENLGNYTQALEYYQQALTMQQALHEGENHAEVADSLRTVGVAYERLGSYAQALEYYQQALAMQQALHEGENHADLATALRTVGVAYEHSGKYTQALEYYQQALTMRKALHEGENHAEVADSLRTVGLTCENLGNYTQALEYYQQALTMQKALHEGEDHDEIAQAFLAVGDACGSLGRLEESIQYYEQALAMPTVSQALKANTGHNLGCMYHVKVLAARQEGDEQQAQAYLEKATTSFEQAVQASSAVEVGLYTEYGNFLLDTRKVAQAYDYLRQAIESGDDASGLGYDLTAQPTVTPVLQAYISQQQEVSLRGIDYAYYLMIHHYEDFQKAGIEMDKTREEYLAAYKESLDQYKGQPGKAQEDKSAYHLLGSLYEAQGDHEAAAAAFARAQDGTEQEDTQAVA